jgi:diphosphomevalonate decarboxylase
MIPSTAKAHPNIAFIKYWGNRDETLRLPTNGSISMNLAGLETRTKVEFLEISNKVEGKSNSEERTSYESREDSLTINEQLVRGAGLQRVTAFLDIVRGMAGMNSPAIVTSESNFPAGAGIASSAAAFAALALAASKAAGLELSQAELSRLARRGSGSACRSIPGGFVEWQMGTSDSDSFAVSIAPPEHWDLVDCVAVLSSENKSTGSTEGHALAGTSPLQVARVIDTPRRLEICRNAIQRRDFQVLAEVVELDSNMMHSVMMTSQPALFYWQAATLTVLQAVREARRQGLPVCYTVDAGPNVHVITEPARAEQVTALLRSLQGVREVLVARVGGPAILI